MSDPLLVDLWEGDLHGHPELERLGAAGYPWCGVVMKTSEGLEYHSDWFLAQWPKAREVGGERYGKDWFRGCYHYARIAEDPIKQCHLHLSRVELAGGWGDGDLPSWLDVEGANNPMHLGAARIEDFISKWAEEYKAATGRAPWLYGNIYLAENGVKSTCGCDGLVVARYTATLPPAIYERIGWTWSAESDVNPPTLVGWQGVGDGVGDWKQPIKSPIGDTDITALVVANGGQAALEWLRGLR